VATNKQPITFETLSQPGLITGPGFNSLLVLGLILKLFVSVDGLILHLIGTQFIEALNILLFTEPNITMKVSQGIG
jgi:hypothetical protein